MNALFDLDNTLHDKRASLASFADHLIERFGLDVESNAFIDCFQTHHEIIQPKEQVFDLIGARFALPRTLKNEMFAVFEATFPDFARPFPGARDALAFLADQGVMLGCVTNGRDHFQRRKIAGLGIDHLFDCVITSEGFGVKKPDSQIFVAALEAIGSSAGDCVFCGDNLQADIEPAKALGMITIWKSDQLSQPGSVDFKLTTFAELPDIWELIAFY